MSIKKKEAVFVVILVLIVGMASYYFGYLKQSDPVVCLDNSCFKVEVVDENSERLVGLMNRTSLAEDKGMLFVWESEGYYPFWMMNTLIPLDMIWIGSEKDVVYIYENAQPCLAEPCLIIYPEANAKYVLEVNAGMVEANNIMVGQTVRFKGIAQ